jgi:hypothetical protein
MVFFLSMDYAQEIEHQRRFISNTRNILAHWNQEIAMYYARRDPDLSDVGKEECDAHFRDRNVGEEDIASAERERRMLWQRIESARMEINFLVQAAVREQQELQNAEREEQLAAERAEIDREEAERADLEGQDV